MTMRLLAAVAAVTVIGFTGVASAGSMKMPTKSRPPAPPPASDWSGCYGGLHLGQAAGHTTWTDSVPNGAIDAALLGRTAKTDMSGGIYGAQVGCDMTFNGSIVAGLEASFAKSMLTGTNMDAFNPNWNLRSEVTWLATATGRIGYSLGNALIYARGGVAWATNKFEVENTGVVTGASSKTRQGWTAGVGVEWAIAPCWTVFLEGNYYTFGSTNVAFAGDAINPTPPFIVQSKLDVESVKFGVNYRFFGDGPVSARF